MLKKAGFVKVVSLAVPFLLAVGQATSTQAAVPDPSSAETQTPEKPQKDVSKNAEQPKRWSLSAQLLKVEKSLRGYDSGVGLIKLKSPDGQVFEYPFKSGGFGRYRNKSMLPCLREHIEGCFYPLDWSSYIYKERIDIGPMNGPNGKGNWLRLLSNRDFVPHRGADDEDRGKVRPGFFGIHTDGVSVFGRKYYKKKISYRKTVCSKRKKGKKRKCWKKRTTRTVTRSRRYARTKGFDGTLGCMGMRHQDADALFEIFESLSEDQRPQKLVIEKPDLGGNKEILEAKLK
ncbi:MAG: hypothetical protein MRY79_08330 [Alphaproteobacteria bacterium]|nr:hypothetical protein [Alphaproteobacteria bacterium]